MKKTGFFTFAQPLLIFRFSFTDRLRENIEKFHIFCNICVSVTIEYFSFFDSSTFLTQKSSILNFCWNTRLGKNNFLFKFYNFCHKKVHYDWLFNFLLLSRTFCSKFSLKTEAFATSKLYLQQQFFTHKNQEFFIQ